MWITLYAEIYDNMLYAMVSALLTALSDKLSLASMELIGRHTTITYHTTSHKTNHNVRL